MKPSTLKVLRLLREAGDRGVSTGEFMEHHIGRAPARIEELRKLHGYEIRKAPVHERRPNGPQRYFLVGPARSGATASQDTPNPSEQVEPVAELDRDAVAPGPAGQLEIWTAA